MTEKNVTRAQRIKRIKAKDFMRVEFVEFSPKPGVITICGKNDQGKSSFLGFLRAVLGGKYEFPDLPVRKGAKQAEGEIETDDFVIEWKFAEGDRGPTIKVRDKARGRNVKGPQSFVRRFVGKFALDIMRFYDMEPREQLEYCNRVMLDADGKQIDLEAFETEKGKLEEKRRDLRRVKDDAEAVLHNAPPVDDPPEKPVDVTAVSEEIEAALKHNAEIDDHKRIQQVMTDRLEAHDTEIADLEARLKKLKAERESIKTDLAKQTKAVKAMKPRDVEDLRKQREDAATVNDAFERHQRHVQARDKAEEARKAFNAADDKVKAFVAEHEERIENGTFPVKDLHWQDGRYVYQDIPLSQQSTRNKIFVAWQLAMAEDTPMKLALIDDANTLDEDAQAYFAELTAQHQADSIVVMVGENHEGAQLVIRDGKGV